MAMWVSKLFGSLPTLLDFVNGHGLGHDQFKIVVVPPRIWQRRSGPRYYLIYRRDEPAPALVAAGEALADAGAAIDEEAAVDTAEEIIASAQGRGHSTGRPGA
jgi:hypothetical protein